MKRIGMIANKTGMNGLETNPEDTEAVVEMRESTVTASLIDHTLEITKLTLETTIAEMNLGEIEILGGLMTTTMTPNTAIKIDQGDLIAEKGVATEEMHLHVETVVMKGTETERITAILDETNLTTRKSTD
jgi:hypothetical protein